MSFSCLLGYDNRCLNAVLEPHGLGYVDVEISSRYKSDEKEADAMLCKNAAVQCLAFAGIQVMIGALGRVGPTHFVKRF